MKQGYLTNEKQKPNVVVEPKEYTTYREYRQALAIDAGTHQRRQVYTVPQTPKRKKLFGIF